MQVTEHDCEHNMWAVMQWNTSSGNIRKQAKRETAAMISYNIVDATVYFDKSHQWHLHPF